MAKWHGNQSKAFSTSRSICINLGYNGLVEMKLSLIKRLQNLLCRYISGQHVGVADLQRSQMEFQ
jgi:hypothetical protein